MSKAIDLLNQFIPGSTAQLPEGVTYATPSGQYMRGTQPKKVEAERVVDEPIKMELPILHSTISGLRGAWSQLSIRYDYVKDGTTCPACGGFGIRWGGWFSCEFCHAKAIIESGRVFINDDPGYTGI